MKTKFYVITDTHFGHEEKMQEYCGRPLGYRERIWNAVYQLPKDCVLIHLGDVCIGNDEYWHADFMRANECRKILVLGNHDRKSVGWYLDHGWSMVVDAFRLEYCGKKILFTHDADPFDTWHDLNIHGHFHNTKHREYREGVDVSKCRLLAIEETNYSPVRLESLL